MSKRVHIVSVSSGVPSAVTAIKVVEKYGKENVILLFADTLAEDEDNYRFLRDLENYLGMYILRLSVGKTPIQFMKDDDVIFTQAFAPCTRKLKLEPIYEFVQTLLDAGIQITMHIGYDFSDKARGRLESTTKNYESIGVQAEYILLDELVFDPQAELERYGLEEPRTYRMGFKHANCIGQGGCVKFGQADMIRVYKNFPDRYARREKFENNIRRNHAVVHITTAMILALYLNLNLGGLRLFDIMHDMYAHVRDTTNPWGYVTLTELRQRYEKAQQGERQLRLFEMDMDMNGCSRECGVLNPDDWQEWRSRRSA